MASAVPGARAADGEGAAAFSGARAFAHLTAQCAYGPRNPGSAGHRAAREYLHRALLAAGGSVTLQTFRHRAPGLPEPVSLTNVIARFGPLRSGGILLGAHWDTRPWADRDPDPRRRGDPILGANDGASGVAVLLTLAEELSRSAPALPVTIVLFDGEDLGREDHPEEYLAGSRYFASHLPAGRPDVAIVIDMVGSASLQLAIEENSRRGFPELAALIDELAQEEEVGGFLAGSGPAVIDDHLPLLEAGIPSILLVDFRDPYWHTHEDTPENCSAESLAHTGRLLLRLLRGGYWR